MTGTKEKKTVRRRQDSLRNDYLEKADEALITDQARTKGGVDTDPFHGKVTLGEETFGVTLPFGIHRAVGGYSDLPNPGDLLCGALAACLDSAVRIIAERFGITLTSLDVEVLANLDVRGTLLVKRSVPVGFQTLKCNVRLKALDGTDPKVVKKLVKAAEHSCVNMQTLLSGVSVETNLNVEV